MKDESKDMTKDHSHHSHGHIIDEVAISKRVNEISKNEFPKQV
jgi:hypothetical protein